MKWFQRLTKKPAPRKPDLDKKGRSGSSETPSFTGDLPARPVSPCLENNLNYLKSILGEQDDIIYRHIRLGGLHNVPACIIYIDGLVDSTILHEGIIKPLMLLSTPGDCVPGQSNLRNFVLELALPASNVTEVKDIEKLVARLLSGEVILLIEGLDKAMLVDIRKHTERPIIEPPSEVLVRGPREGFTETLQTNITLLRRRVKDPNLRFESRVIGRATATQVVLIYINGIVSPQLVAEVNQRLQRIDVDSILDSGYLEEFIEDNPFSPFPQMLHTERPDRVAGCILEGQVAILVDGSPFALIMPAQLASFINTPEDYYERYALTTALRWVRWISFSISLFLPSLYIATTTFHQEMIPSRLLVSIASYRQGLPFSTLFEALLMEFVFEILREAGVRLPRAIGQAVSIAGALVIGQSAVTAGIVSPLMVIVVAATGIASFTIPTYNMGLTIRLLRFPLMLLAGTFGLFGIMIGMIMLTIHATNLRSFGTPYLSPLAPLNSRDLKDILVRAPWWQMKQRPAEYAKTNPHRQAADMKPGPAQSGHPQGRKR
jgi:spore germination protein KA